MSWAGALTSIEPVDVLSRVLGFTLFWVLVRVVASHALFSDHEKRVRQGTSTVVVLHSMFQAVAAIWLVCCDPVIAPLLRQVAGQPAALDLANCNSPGVALLATIAAGEMAAQLLHIGWWYEGPGDMLLAFHHGFSAAIWPLAVMSCRSHFFVANMLVYELSTPFMGLLHFSKGSPTARAVCGTLFTLSFVLVRLCTIPITLYVEQYSTLVPHPSTTPVLT